MNSSQIRICVLTTSYPRHSEDDASIFVQRMIRAMSKQDIAGFILVPRDSTEPQREQTGPFTVIRFSYSLFRKGALAFGGGIVPNMKRDPLLALQAPGLLFSMFWNAWKLRKQYDI